MIHIDTISSDLYPAVYQHAVWLKSFLLPFVTFEPYLLSSQHARRTHTHAAAEERGGLSLKSAGNNGVLGAI